MSLVNSPKVKYDPHGAQERIPVRVYLVRGANITLVITAIVLALVVWFGGDVVNRAFGRTGTVQGIVLDENGAPIANSEIFLIAAPDQMVRTDANGSFTLANVPTGMQELIVSTGRWGQEYRVSINERQMTQAGALTFLTPPADD